MSSGTSVYSMITGLGDAFSKSYESSKKDALASDLGDKIKAGDYAGAADIALKAGDLQTGLGLVKLGEGRGANKQLAETLGGLFGGGASPAGGGFGETLTSGYKAGGGTGATAYKTDDPVAEGLKPQQKALLNAIAGGESAGKYNIRFTPRGGALFDGFSQHPGIAEMGPDGPSTAAGRYQFTKTTWDGMGGGDFSPENQDRRALQLASRDYGIRTGRDLDADLAAQGFSPAIQRALAPTWRALAGNNERHAATFAEGLARYGSEAPATATASLTPQPAAPRPAPVAVANNEAETQALESRMGMMPPGMVAEADAANMPAAGARTAEFRIPPGPGAGRTLGVPAPHNTTAPGAGGTGVSDAGGTGETEQGAEAPATALATAPAKPTFTMPAPLALARAGVPMQASMAVGRTTPGSPERVQALVRASLIPGISEQAQGVVKALLANELDQSKATSDQREYDFARRQGFQGTFLDYKNALSGNRDEGAKITAQIQARTDELIRAGLDPNDPANRRYRLTGQMAEEKPDKTPDAVAKVNDALTNWQRYRLPDPNDPANAGYWKDFSAKTLGGSGGTTVNVGSGETEEAKELGKARGKRAGDIEAAAMKAPDQIGKLSLLGSVLDRARTGAFGPAESTVVGFAQAAGIPDTTIAKLGLNPQQAISSQAATKLINEAVTGMIGGGGFPANNFSDADRSFLQDIFPKMSNRAEANRLAIEVMKRVQGRNLEFGDGWQEYQQAQREAGKPASVSEYEFNFRKGLRGKPGLFDDLRQEFDTLPKGGGQPQAGADTGGGSSVPQFSPSTSRRISMQDAQTLKGADDTAENRQAFDARYGEGAAQFVLRRPAPAGATSSGAAPGPPLPKGADRMQIPDGVSAGAMVAEARKQVAAGRDREAVTERLRRYGIDPKRIDD